MYLASYKVRNEIKWGVVDIIKKVLYTSKSVFGENAPKTILEYIKSNQTGKYKAIDFSVLKEGISLSKLHITAPIAEPIRNIFCIGKNYLDHIKELSDFDEKQFSLYDVKPIFFTKCTTAINGPYDDIPQHKNITNAIDYEAELAVIIGKEGINIKKEDAYEYIFGYAVLNDVTARDLQKSHKQWLKGKGLDGFCPMGPWIVTKDEIKDAQNLSIKSFVNRELRQDSNTSNMIFNIAQMIEDLSHGITLMPGDIIATGTPSGVGAGFNPPKFLKSGDTVKVFVESIGEIENRIG